MKGDTHGKTKKLVNVNEAALRGLLGMTGKSLGELSEEMGFSRRYLGMVIKSGHITETTALMLDNLYGIGRGMYEAHDMPVGPAETAVEARWGAGRRNTGPG